MYEKAATTPPFTAAATAAHFVLCTDFFRVYKFLFEYIVLEKSKAS